MKKIIDFFKNIWIHEKLDSLTDLEKGIIYVNQFYFDKHPESLESDKELKTILMKYYEHILIEQEKLDYDITKYLTKTELDYWEKCLDYIVKQHSASITAKIKMMYDNTKKNL